MNDDLRSCVSVCVFYLVHHTHLLCRMLHNDRILRWDEIWNYSMMIDC